MNFLGGRWENSTQGFTSLQFELFKAPGVSFCTHSTYSNDIFKLPELSPLIAVLPIVTATWNKQSEQLPPWAGWEEGEERGMTATKPKKSGTPCMEAVNGWKVLDVEEEEVGCEFWLLLLPYLGDMC